MTPITVDVPPSHGRTAIAHQPQCFLATATKNPTTFHPVAKNDGDALFAIE